MSILLNQSGNPPCSRITLHTRKGTEIPNQQDWHLSSFIANQNRQVISDKKWVNVRWRTTQGSPVYNCHGLTFAGRRTNVSDSASITTILKDDGFHEIPLLDILPGDVILYLTAEGEAEHSGVVAEVKPADGRGRLPEIWIFSKWGAGSEALHRVYECPYNQSKVKYFRVKDENT